LTIAFVTRIATVIWFIHLCFWVSCGNVSCRDSTWPT